MTQEMENKQRIYEVKSLEKDYYEKLRSKLWKDFIDSMEKQNDITDYLNHLSSEEVNNNPGILSCGQRYERENNKEEEN